jgi:hypothetical protein
LWEVDFHLGVGPFTSKHSDHVGFFAGIFRCCWQSSENDERRADESKARCILSTQTNLEIILSSQGALASWPRAGVEHFDHSVDSRCPYPANIVLQTNIADEKIVDIDVATVPASFSIPAAARRYGRSRVIAACSVRNGSGSVPADPG